MLSKGIPLIKVGYHFEHGKAFGDKHGIGDDHNVSSSKIVVASKKMFGFVPTSHVSHVVSNSIIKSDKRKCVLFDKPTSIVGMRRFSDKFFMLQWG